MQGLNPSTFLKNLLGSADTTDPILLALLSLFPQIFTNGQMQAQKEKQASLKWGKGGSLDRYTDENRFQGIENRL